MFAIRYLMPIHKWHPSAPAGVLDFWKSSPYPSCACGFQFAAALSGTKICQFWMDTNYAVGNSAGMAYQPVVKDSKMYTVLHQADASIAKIAT